MSNHEQTLWYGCSAFSGYKVKEKTGSLLGDIHYGPDAGALHLSGNWNISFVTDKKKKKNVWTKCFVGDGMYRVCNNLRCIKIPVFLFGIWSHLTPSVTAITGSSLDLPLHCAAVIGDAVVGPRNGIFKGFQIEHIERTSSMNRLLFLLVLYIQLLHADLVLRTIRCKRSR